MFNELKLNEYTKVELLKFYQMFFDSSRGYELSLIEQKLNEIKE